MTLSIIARVLGAAVSIYMLLCLLRVFLTWVPGANLGRPGELLETVTEPYLGFFSRFSFLRAGRFDFSPIAALAVLVVLNNVLMTLAYTGKIGIGAVLGMLIQAVWSAFSFIIYFLAGAALVRLIAYVAHWNSLHPLWRVIDAMLNPLLYRVNRVIYRGRIVNYLQGLVTGLAVLILAGSAGGALVRLLARLLASLPF